MDVKPFTVKVNNTTIHAELAIPEAEKVKDNLVIVLAHGHNYKKGMHQELIDYLFRGLARRGFCTARFNFLYIEQKKKTRDDNQTLIKTYKAVLKEIKKQGPKTIILGGFSLGSWVAAGMARRSEGDGALLLGLPLTHKDDKIPLKKLFDIKIPMLICNGTEDKYTNPRDLMDLVENLRHQGGEVEHFMVDAVSHAFEISDNPTDSQVTVYQELIEMIDRWIGHHWY